MNPTAGDTGLANERTALAWQRTALATLAGAGIVARLTWTDLGTVAVVVLTLAGLLGLWVFIESWARYSHAAGTRLRPRPRGGRAPAAVAAAVALIAATELAAVLV